jgi:hypothetical protein
MDPRKRFFVIASLFSFLIPLAGCPNNDDNNSSLTPSTTGVAVSSVKSFTEVAGVVIQMIDGINEAAAGPPLAAPKQTRTIPSSIPCESGSVSIAVGLSDYTVTAHDCVADGGSLLFKEGTTAVVAPFTLDTCTMDMGVTVSPAPQQFSVVFNGSVSVDSVDFNLTNLNLYFLNVVYDQRGSCNIDTFDGTLSGTVSNGATIDFSALAFSVPFISDTEVWLETDGTFSVDTPCDENVTYTLATVATMHIPIDGSCPTEGILGITKLSDGSSAQIDFAADPSACDAQACQAG